MTWLTPNLHAKLFASKTLKDNLLVDYISLLTNFHLGKRSSSHFAEHKEDSEEIALFGPCGDSLFVTPPSVHSSQAHNSHMDNSVLPAYSFIASNNCRSSSKVGDEKENDDSIHVQEREESSPPMSTKRCLNDIGEESNVQDSEFANKRNITLHRR